MFWRKKKKRQEPKKLTITDLLKKVQVTGSKCPPLPCACTDCPMRFSGFMGGCEYIPWHITLCAACRRSASDEVMTKFVGECSVKKSIQGEFDEEKKGRDERAGGVVGADNGQNVPEPGGKCLPSIDEISTV